MAQRPNQARTGGAATSPHGWTVRDSGIVIPPFEPGERPEMSLLARPAVIDRYPLVLGSEGLTSQYLSSAFRLCNTGWRYQFVDALDELLEHDPDARAPVRQRVLGVAFGRVEVSPPKLRKGHPDQKLAEEIAEHFRDEFLAIPRLSQRIAQLNWAVIYGLSSLEINWKNDDGGWQVAGLSNIRNRRLNYPDPTSWDLHIWDQGTVGPGFDSGPTQGLYGLRVLDYPGKFVVHTPSLNNDYPTRDGEGRYIAFYMLLKRMVTRVSAQDFERVIRPWVIGKFNKDANENGTQPAASKEDIRKLDQAIEALGMGAMNGAVLPETVKVELLRAASAMSATEFLGYLTRAITKSLLGQSFTTEPGANGNRSTADTASKDTLKILKYDARCLCDSLEEDIGWPWTRLNYEQAKRHIAPRIDIIVDELPTPKELMDLAAAATEIDVAVDADEIGVRTGLPLVRKDEADKRRTKLVSAAKPEGEQGQEGPEDNVVPHEDDGGGGPDGEPSPEDDGGSPKAGGEPSDSASARGASQSSETATTQTSSDDRAVSFDYHDEQERDENGRWAPGGGGGSGGSSESGGGKGGGGDGHDSGGSGRSGGGGKSGGGSGRGGGKGHSGGSSRGGTGKPSGGGGASAAAPGAQQAKPTAKPVKPLATIESVAKASTRVERAKSALETAVARGKERIASAETQAKSAKSVVARAKTVAEKAKAKSDAATAKAQKAAAAVKGKTGAAAKAARTRTAKAREAARDAKAAARKATESVRASTKKLRAAEQRLRETKREAKTAERDAKKKLAIETKRVKTEERLRKVEEARKKREGEAAEKLKKKIAAELGKKKSQYESLESLEREGIKRDRAKQEKESRAADKLGGRTNPEAWQKYYEGKGYSKQSAATIAHGRAMHEAGLDMHPHEAAAMLAPMAELVPAYRLAQAYLTNSKASTIRQALDTELGSKLAQHERVQAVATLAAHAAHIRKEGAAHVAVGVPHEMTAEQLTSVRTAGTFYATFAHKSLSFKSESGHHLEIEFDEKGIRKVDESHVGRAFYTPSGRSNYKQRPNWIYGEERAGHDVLVHEMAHSAEACNAKMGKRAIGFLADRTKGESLQKLKELRPDANYGENEVARPDRFRNPYAGKDYGGQATEISSMVFQDLSSSFHALYKADRESFYWGLGQLAAGNR